MTRYQVDSEAVLGATNAVRGSIGRIQAEVGALHGQLVSLQDSWSGQAATAFQSVVDRVEVDPAARRRDASTRINRALGQAGQQYAEIEAANARLFSR